ncbi:MAG: DUF6359 domain-containing protein [Clostridium sp.]|nr:DUF6359 domain-containing protein [Prevotella sp.]MCM1428509.1 DUF6359 domain-containing protein [Clostridium sp.]MCM1475861.1 DUF6359 domain-containing protein [Muribaculaceae bacterium]
MHRIINIAIMALMAIGFVACNDDAVLPPVPVPEGGFESIGNGSWDKPISAFQAYLGHPSDDQEIWTYGYIVGWIDTDATPAHVLNSESARYTKECGTETNLLISMSLPWKVETNENGDYIFNEDGTPKFELDENGKIQIVAGSLFWEKCATVQLPSGDVRNKLNLSKNPNNLGKLVSLKGTTGSKYCGQYGVRSVSMYNWGNEGIYEEPQEPVPPMPGIAEGITFTKVTDVVDDGQYLLVFDNKYMTGPVEPSTYTYGYLPCSNVTPDGDKIVTSTLNAYMFYKVEGGWEIRDGYGRYVWWDSDPSHNSFQLTLNKRGSEGMVWTVTPNADGTVKITNVQFNLNMGYYASKNNVGAYSNTNNPMPVLYKRSN